MNISPLLLAWYQENKRHLPWRETTDAYTIWVSEIILQQTRVAQGMDYFYRFTQAFPTAKHLAEASETEVLRLWQGLGYYSRARNMHKTAKMIVEYHNGIFPTQYKAILSLPGIGTYTAAAIASFANNEPYAVVDGNVYRVLSRILGIDAPIDTTAGKKLFNKLAQEFLDKAEPAQYNQAMMDFGAIQCTPQSPNCDSCPFAEQCEAYRTHQTDNLPVKSKKITQRKRFFWYLDIWNENYTYLQQRNQKDIWQGLYEPLLLEESLSIAELFNHPTVKTLRGTIVHVSPLYKHVLSHQIIEARFAKIHVIQEPALLQSMQKISDTELSLYPVSRLIDKYRKDLPSK